MDKINAKVFLTVAETGSFRKAASMLGYTQAGISYIISGMENETGLHLFERERNGVRLSGEGKLLLPQMKQLEIWERQFQQTITELNGLKRGIVRIQIFDSISIHWIPGIISRFHGDFPGVKIELITEEDSARAEQMVLSGEVDCGFFLTHVKSDVDYFPLMEENMKAVIPLNHPMAKYDKFPLSRLGDFPYISMKYDDNTGMRGIFTEHGVKPMTAFCLDNDYAALAMARAGLGFCIFPELLLTDMPDGLKSMEFDQPQKRTISIGTASVQTCSKACLKFMEYTKEWVSEYKKSR